MTTACNLRCVALSGIIVACCSQACNAISGVNDFAFDQDLTFPSSSSSGNGGNGGNGGSGGSGGNGGGAPLSCDALAECGAFDNTGCVGCAIGPGGDCEIEAIACFADTLCQSFALCMAGCLDPFPDCQMNCETQFPGGTNAAAPLGVCVYCLGCPTACTNPGVLCM